MAARKPAVTSLNKGETSAEAPSASKSGTHEVAKRKKGESKAAPKAAGPILALPDGDSKQIEPLRLLLDPQNLRLLERTGGAFESLDVKLFGQNPVQQKLFEIIDADARFDIVALADSIANNGFLKHERIIVAPYDAEKFLVLEGNRILTAVRHLIMKHGVNF